MTTFLVYLRLSYSSASSAFHCFNYRIVTLIFPIAIVIFFNASIFIARITVSSTISASMLPRRKHTIIITTGNHHEKNQ